ncbi:MAG TPA: 6,7-dimethyl-8-ribityllumazine synthase [Flavisolibacter sp.]|jgi:6,7-dimethyl-8-ribityllumazine synthase
MADVSNSKLFKSIEDIQQLKDVLVVLVKTEWNSEIVDELERGCLKVFGEYGIQTKTLVVPGAIEIPFAIQQYSETHNAISAFIALGCVIRGGTPHFEYVCQSVTLGVTQLNLSLTVPVIFGVLTLDNLEQAKERTGGVHGHKGEEAAVTAIKMMILNKQIKASH